MDANNPRQFRVAAIKQFSLSSILLVVQTIVFFVSAGFVSFRYWLFFTASVVHFSVGVAVQYRLNPWLLVQRLKAKREGSKLWDEVLMRATNLTMLILAPLVAGLDVGRFGWPIISPYFVWLGFVFFAASTVLLNWAMAMNKYFEPTVRIQEKHKVITGGPYKFVRHPGYLAGILYSLTFPFIVGSLFSFVAVAVYVILIMLRTWLEDNTLQQELDGYKKYAEETRFRLFPGLW